MSIDLLTDVADFLRSTIVVWIILAIWQYRRWKRKRSTSDPSFARKEWALALSRRADRALLITVALVVFAVLGWPKYSGLLFGTRGSTDDVFGRLSRYSNERNKTLPMMVDRDTELTGIGVDHPATVIYKHRLVNETAGATTDLPQTIVEYMRPRVRTQLCSTPDSLELFKKYGTTFRYSYYDRDLTYLASVEVTPRDCGL